MSNRSKSKGHRRSSSISSIPSNVSLCTDHETSESIKHNNNFDRTCRSKSVNLSSIVSQDSSYLYEKSVDKYRIPVFKTKGYNEYTNNSLNLMTTDPRDPYVDIRTLDKQLIDLINERDRIDVCINSIKKRLLDNNDDKRPSDWIYNHAKLRTTYFDEQKLLSGDLMHVPRVVTVIWSHNRQTGVTRYGAVQWTKGYNDDIHNKNTQRMYATKRYSSDPIIIRLDPIPKTNYELTNCLRWIIHTIGVESNSKKFKKWKSFVIRDTHDTGNVIVHKGRDALRNPLIPGTKL